MILRDATPQDAQALAALGRESFCAAFGTLYDPADLNAFLTSAYSVEAVAEEIAAPGITHQLAQDPASGALTGYIKMRHPSNYAHHSTAADPVELGQLYCDGAHTGCTSPARAGTMPSCCRSIRKTSARSDSTNATGSARSLTSISG
jgi:hypothetical protein